MISKEHENLRSFWSDVILVSEVKGTVSGFLLHV